MGLIMEHIGKYFIVSADEFFLMIQRNFSVYNSSKIRKFKCELWKFYEHCDVRLSK